MDRVAVVGAALGDPKAHLFVEAAGLRQVVDCPEKYFAKVALATPFESGGEQRLSGTASVVRRIDDEEPKLRFIRARFPADHRDRTDQHATDVGRQHQIFLGVIMFDKIAELARNQELKGRT